MKKSSLTRRDFLKLAGISTVVAVPAAFGYKVYRSAQGEFPVVRSPYAENITTEHLDGSVPILLIVNITTTNPFGFYLEEILHAEGLNWFHSADLSDISIKSLEKYHLIILAETQLNTEQVEMFKGYVARGGRLIGMKPDDRLAPVFGVERVAGSVSEGYIKTDPNNPASEGINPSTMQFHGAANQYRLAGAQGVAWLFTDRDTSTEYPALALNKFGDGMTVLFSFDLAKSIVYMRQGNPEFKGQDRDGHPYIRATDMFVDWIDLERIGIPQADEQQRLFVKLIHELSKDKLPLPRFWYLPGEADAVIIATGDAHPMSGTETIDNVLARVEQRNGHMSIYYSFTLHDDLYRFAQRGRFLTGKLPFAGDWLREHYKTPTPDDVANWRKRGHEFTLHPHVGTSFCGGFGVDGFVSFNSIEDGWQTYWQQFTGLGYGPVSQTVRTHCVLWKDWTETARLQTSYGIRMNYDYYHVGPAFRKKNGDWVYGHFTGSGLPMRFIDDQGRMIEIYQQLTQFADEHFFSFPEINWVDVGNYTAESALEVAKDTIQFNLDNAFPAAFGMQFHPDPFAYGGRPADIAGKWLEGILDYAVEAGIPIWSAQDWLRFNQTRRGIKVVPSVVNEGGGHVVEYTVAFQEGASSGTEGEQVFMLPAVYGSFHLVSIELNGVHRDTAERSLSGISYRWLPISADTQKIVAYYA